MHGRQLCKTWFRNMNIQALALINESSTISSHVNNDPLGDFGSFSGLGSNASNPRGRTDQNWQLDGNITWIHGRHNWKAGYEFRRTTVN